MSNFHPTSTWRSKHPYFKNLAPKPLQHWLTDRESLTKAIIQTCPQKFSVRVLDESWQQPTYNEARKLQMKPNTLAYVRQVHLFCGDTAWVYARTVIPQPSLRGELQKLTKLGTQPLAAVLFANKHVQRGELETTQLSKQHASYKTALTFSKKSAELIWGRRSLFFVANNPLMVSEIFLPEIPKKATF